MRLGSLFDGSGTAPLCAAILGWEPVWASEIEPFPVKVTSKRFPRMKHLGDITQINGAQIEPVDVIVGGSPCQDLSVAGKQAGLQSGTRSHLFYEMTRIIKEMRRATNGKYPRYVVWENVPGAFSSNKGRDFHEVLKAFCAIADHPCDVPEPPRGGGRAGADKLVWGNAGLIMGDGFSLGWRVLDAQFWGVPQRRRRIFLAVDFGGERGREILFERESMSWDPQQGREARESAAAAAVGCSDRGAGIRCLNDGDSQTIRQYDVDGVYTALMANATGGQNRQDICYAIEGNTVDRNSAQNGRGYSENVSPTLDAQDRHGVVTIDCRNGALNADISGVLQANPTSLNSMNPVVYPCVEITNKNNRSNPQPGDPCCTLGTDNRNYLVAGICLSIGNGQMRNISMAEMANALDCMHDQQAVLTSGKPPRRYIVRRLTPLECCRLQGFPDWWVYGCETQPVSGWWTENDVWRRAVDPHGEVQGSDSAIYKMWGNGMALPCMLYVLSGLEGIGHE